MVMLSEKEMKDEWVRSDLEIKKEKKKRKKIC